MSDVARRIRSTRQVWAAPGGSHDRLIGFLGFALPSAIGVLAAFLVLAPLTRSGDASFLLAKNNVAVAQERLKIEAATYRGEDSKGRAFQLTAGSAIQKSSAEPIVHLNDLAAQIDGYDRRRASIHPYKPRDPARWGDVPFYGWSEDKARQYGVPQRPDFGAFVRGKGFKLD